MVRILDVLKQNAGVPFSEFFIDELGNFVLRDFLDAIHKGREPVSIDSSGNVQKITTTNVTGDKQIEGYADVINPITGLKELKYVWHDINSQDIITWKVTKSDANLKTVVINNLVSSIVGNKAVYSDLIRAPISAKVYKYIADSLQGSLKNDKSGQDLVNNVPIESYLARIAKSEVTQVNGYSLANLDESGNGLKAFWQRYGFRVDNVMDIISQTAIEGVLNAHSYFLYNLFNMWSGQITIVGDPQIKIGNTLYIKDLNTTFYIKGVTHSFVFGGTFTTTLQVMAGRIKDTLNDPYAVIKTIKGGEQLKYKEYLKGL